MGSYGLFQSLLENSSEDSVSLGLLYFRKVFSSVLSRLWTLSYTVLEFASALFLESGKFRHDDFGQQRPNFQSLVFSITVYLIFTVVPVRTLVFSPCSFYQNPVKTKESIKPKIHP
jgi:ABC-type Na+ efflux pump permease subunit